MPTCDICFDFDVAASLVRRENIRNATSSVNLTTFQEIDRSAQNGCRTCGLLWEGIKIVEGSSLTADLSTRLHILLDVGLPIRIEYHTKQLEMFIPKGKILPSTDGWRMTDLLGNVPAWPCLGHASILEPDLTHSKAALLAKTWLQKCYNEHATCRQLEHASLPKRVLYIGSESSSNVHLYSAKNKSAPYVALSYCWGSETDNLTTTKKNISERESGIDWNVIPKTVRDAISITRLLGIRYLWVDALCIIQDDIQDWRNEAAKMAAVYEGATLVISATRAASVVEGFIKPRDSDLQGYRSWKSDLSSHEGMAVSVYIREQLPHQFIIPDMTYRSKHNPLLSRGWAFQERLLARRTVHFLEDEVVWECRSEFWCECSSCTVNLKQRAASQKSSFFSRFINDPSTSDPTQLWHSLIADYSTRKVTKTEDTLPALSGIVSKLQNMGMGQYCAGLWRKDLEYHLLWQSDLPDRTLSLTPAQLLRGANFLRGRTGPTWSWTSSPYAVKWSVRDPRNCQSEIVVLRMGCNVWETYGRIELRGQMTPATVERLHEGFGLRKEDRRWVAKFHPNVPGDGMGQRTVFCILLYSTEKGDSGSRSYRNAIWGGLVVVPSRQYPNAYERIGIVEGEEDSQLETGWFGGHKMSHIVLV